MIAFRPCGAQETYLTTDGKFTPCYKGGSKPTLPLIILERIYHTITLTVKVPLEAPIEVKDFKISITGCHPVEVLEVTT